MASRKFLRAMIVTGDSSFVAVIEPKARGWVCFTVSPGNIWSPEFKAKAIKADPKGSWELSAFRDAYGGQVRTPNSMHPTEFHKRNLRAGSLHEAILATQTWLRKFSSKKTVVVLLWSGVSFTLKNNDYYSVHVNAHGDDPREWYPCHTLGHGDHFMRSPLVRRISNDSVLKIQLVAGKERFQSTFQELADMLP